MSERIHVLAQQLLGKSTVEACGLQEIKDLVSRYPYFAPAQFLLLEKLKQENDPQYNSQLQKSVLYYHNPVAFEYFIASEKFYTDENIEVSISIQEDDLENKELTTHLDGSSGEDVLENEPIPEKKPEPFTAGSAIAGEIEDKDELSENLVDEDLNIKEPVREVRIELPDFKSPATEGPAFEPYHTVDYFASQGIKITQEEAPKDKFGRQLRSFTEWLKTMKKIPVSETASDHSSEQNVQHLAEDSVHQADIVTEAMAEVWLKQGNNQKALEIYQQLSLINPSKKAYFAALIEKLKQS